MNFKDHIYQGNIHHAYLIESGDDKVRKELISFLKDINGKKSNPDFFEIKTDSFKIEDARVLKSMTSEKSFSEGKKIFFIKTNHILREAQNAMLKIFEEPFVDTHFFVIIPDISSLLKTFVSRFYLIRLEDQETNLKEAETFIKLSPTSRIEYIKENFGKQAKEDEDEDIEEEGESVRTKALIFLNALEKVLYQKIPPHKTKSTILFDQILKVRTFLNQPGSSVKNMMDSVALSIPYGI